VETQEQSFSWKWKLALGGVSLLVIVILLLFFGDSQWCRFIYIFQKYVLNCEVPFRYNKNKEWQEWHPNGRLKFKKKGDHWVEFRKNGTHKHEEGYLTHEYLKIRYHYRRDYLENGKGYREERYGSNGYRGFIEKDLNGKMIRMYEFISLCPHGHAVIKDQSGEITSDVWYFLGEKVPKEEFIEKSKTFDISKVDRKKLNKRAEQFENEKTGPIRYYNERVFRTKVGGLMGLSLEQRVNEYENIITKLKRGEDPVRGEKKYAAGFIDEIILLDDFDGLYLLQKKIKDRSIKKRIFECLLFFKKYKKVKGLLHKISLENTWCVDILPYYPNGAELLMSIVDKTDEDINRRVKAVQIIGREKICKALSGLKKHEYDKTPVKIYQEYDEYRDIYNTFGDVCRSEIWHVKGEDANTIIEYLTSEDNDAIEQALFLLVFKGANVQREYNKKEKNNIEKCLINLLLSKNNHPKIFHLALTESTYIFQDVFKIPEVMASIQKGIEIYNKIESEKPEDTKKTTLHLKKRNNYYKLEYKENK